MTSPNDILELMRHGHAARKTGSLHHFTLRKNLISFPAFERTINEIALLHYRWKKSGVCEGLLIYGQHGSGKSTTVEHYEGKFPRKRIQGVIKIPVLRVTTPETPSVIALSDALLTSLGDPLATRGTAAMKLNRIVHFLKECDVEMLILDEFHHFYDTHRVMEGRRVSDWLKNLMNVTKVCIVVVGLPRAIAVLNANPQLRRRFAAPFHHREFGFVSAEAQREFRGLLDVIENRLPVRFNAPLATPEVARQMFYASNGLIDYVVKIVDGAVVNSNAKQGQEIPNSVLVESFKRNVWEACPDWLNPFLADKLRRLTQTREPFCDWDDPAAYMASERSIRARSSVDIGAGTTAGVAS